ncbi:MAG: FmdB family transcriptional regulator [candidate division Zixibacteria bacterium CG_4_9_14_3_um_filter_46_8]|nr:MAG: FmdB family transcriptional regulator [candidate division Zixibacteria bacterium CG_4_9_14_3_um_filter_46_8]
MPTYEYHCDCCGEDFEEFQKITDPPLTACTSCGKNGKVRRLISAGAGLLFKGSGFYATDYRSSSYKRAAEADKSLGLKSESGSSSSKTEKKSRTKADD